MIEHHPWARIAHHFADAFAHILPIAVNGAQAAGGLVVAVAAIPQTGAGIFHQLAAVVAKRFVSLLVPAVKPDHHFHRPAFVVNAVHLAVFFQPLFSIGAVGFQLQSFFLRHGERYGYQYPCQTSSAQFLGHDSVGDVECVAVNAVFHVGSCAVDSCFYLVSFRKVDYVTHFVTV